MASCCLAEPWSAVPEWMATAEGDWEALEILLTRNSPRLRDAVVFHAQPSVEKRLKARLIQLGQPVDKIHDLAALSRQLEAVDGEGSWDAEELSDRSWGAMLARHPGPETSAEEQAEPVQIASGLRKSLWILLGTLQRGAEAERAMAWVPARELHRPCSVIHRSRDD